MNEAPRPVRVGQKSDLPYRSELEQQAFFQQALGRAKAAESAAGTIDRYFDVAGFVLKITFAGPALVEDFCPALMHLEVRAQERVDAHFHVWDSESTGIAMVQPICSHEAFTDRGDIWGMGSLRYRSAFHWGEYAVALMDTRTATGMYWTHSPLVLPYWAKASPLRTLFHWWMETKGRQLIHGAAVGDRNGAVLITGRGGLGKSTTAISSLLAGLCYIADDYLIVALEPEPRLYSLYSTGKLNWDQMARFPALSGRATSMNGPEDAKAVIHLHPAMKSQIVRSLPLKAILTPGIGEQRETLLEAVAPAELRRAAAFTTMAQLPYAGRNTQDFVARLVDSRPGFRLKLGSDLSDAPRAIERLLAHDPDTLAAMARAVPAPGPWRRPPVSVIVPVRNGASFLAECVASIVAQNYSPLEIIVVDDGSTDDIAGALARLPTKAVYIRRPASGQSAARNHGIRAASGELIAFLDVDDLWPLDNLSLMVDAIIGPPGHDIVQGFAQLVQLMPETGEYQFVGSPRDAFADYLGAAIYRRSVFERIGMLDETLRFAEDSDWFNRAREQRLDIERLEQVTLHVRRHGQNMTYGKSAEELNALKVLKMALDRVRQGAKGP